MVVALEPSRGFTPCLLSNAHKKSCNDKKTFTKDVFKDAVRAPAVVQVKNILSPKSLIPKVQFSLYQREATIDG